MSFAKGFGDSFSRSYGDQMDRYHQEARDAKAADEDMFKMKFQARLADREKYEKRKEEDTKYVNKARFTAQKLGLDSKTIPAIAQMYASGSDEKYVEESLSNGTWDFSSVPDVQSKPAIDTQTEAALGQAQPSVGAEAQPPKERPSWLKKVLNPGGLPEPAPTHEQRMTEVMGDTSYLDKPYESGYEDNGAVFVGGPPQREIPSEGEAAVGLQRAEAALDADPENPALQEAYRKAKIDHEGYLSLIHEKAAAEAVATGNADPRFGLTAKVRENGGTGKVVKTFKIRQDPMHPGVYVDNEGRKYTPDEVASLDLIQQDEIEAKEKAINTMQGDETFKNYRTASGGLTALSEDLAIMDGLVDAHPEILTDGYINTAQFADATIRNADALAKGFSSAVDEYLGSNGQEEIPQGLVEEASAVVKKWGNTAPAKAVDAAVLFQARKLLAGYRLGEAMGQYGKSVAEGERKAFMEAVTAGHDLTTFRQNAGNILQSLESKVDRTADEVKNSPVMSGFFTDHGYYPIEELGKWRDTAKQNEKVNHILTVTDKAFGATTPGVPKEPTLDSPTPQTQTQSDPELDDQLQSELSKINDPAEFAKQVKILRQEYDADHGPGAFDRNVLLK